MHTRPSAVRVYNSREFGIAEGSRSAGILLQTTLKIGEILFELFEREAKCKYAFQFAARQATHHAFITKHRYLGCVRLKRGLKSVK